MFSSPLLLGYGLLNEQLNVRSRQLLHWLNADEQADLEKRNYRVASRSSQYIYSRLLLKVILSRALGVKAHSLSIRTSSNGQPLLFQSGRHVENASLSVSHDKDRLLVAAGFGFQCGVDVQAFKQVDWALVMRAMGWSERIEHLLEASSAIHPIVHLNHVTCSALVWSAYEAWMKATACSLVPSDFAWQQIHLVAEDAVTHSSYFKMTMGARCAYNKSRILISLRADEVLAIATITL